MKIKKKTEFVRNVKLSDQFIGSIMMAFQKCLAEEKDMMDLLREFNVYVDPDKEVFVENPPVVKFSDLKLTEDDEEEKDATV